MYQNPAPLKAATFSGKRAAVSDYAFAARQMLAPLIIDEVADVAREYVILFPVDSELPAALLGTQPEHNAYVSAQGGWQASYVPAMIRRYPFALKPVPRKEGQGEQRFAVIFDQAALDDTGQALFNAEQPAPWVKQRMAMLERLQLREPVTRHLVKVIADTGLLTEQVLQVTTAEGQKGRLDGFRVVDEKALNALDHAAFAELRDAGALPLIYAHLLSLANLRHGVIAGRLPSARHQQSPSNDELEGLFDGNDDLSFDFDS